MDKPSKDGVVRGLLVLRRRRRRRPLLLGPGEPLLLPALRGQRRQDRQRRHLRLARPPTACRSTGIGRDKAAADLVQGADHVHDLHDQLRRRPHRHPRGGRATCTAHGSPEYDGGRRRLGGGQRQLTGLRLDAEPWRWVLFQPRRCRTGHRRPPLRGPAAPRVTRRSARQQARGPGTGENHRVTEPSAAGSMSGHTAWGRRHADAAAAVSADRDGQRGGPARRGARGARLGERRRRVLRPLLGDDLSIHVGGAGVSLDLREWVNSGLMTFFFFVVGLEARREFDMGELRERRRARCRCSPASAAWPCRSRIYLAFNAGRPSAHGWGVAMSTDTAFALGMLALVGPRLPDRLRAFCSRVVVVDDIVALVVIATVYTETSRRRRCWSRSASSRAVLVAARCGMRHGLVYALLGVGAWVALLEVGRRPGRRRARDGPAHVRLPGGRGRPRAGDRAVPRCSASSRRPSSRAPRGVGAAPRDLAERAAAAALPPVDELRDRAALRARQRRHRDRRRLRSRARSRSPITLGILFGYVARQAGRHRRRLLARRRG